MIDLKKSLPFWLNKPEITLWATAKQLFWERAEIWLDDVLGEADLATCSATALELHAWGRALRRIPGEPDALWRTRVRHAIDIAQRAGVRKGLDDALAYYGLTSFAVIERDPAFGEDTVRI